MSVDVPRTLMTGSVTLHIDAPPEKVWALVSDPTRIGEFSPETLGGRWVEGATGPAPGAKFQGHVKRNGRGPMYWATATIVEYEPGRVFGFQVGLPGITGGNTWRYELSPAGAGTHVTESFEVTGGAFVGVYAKVFGTARTRTNVRGMRATLERMKAAAEAA